MRQGAGKFPSRFSMQGGFLFCKKLEKIKSGKVNP